MAQTSRFEGKKNVYIWHIPLFLPNNPTKGSVSVFPSSLSVCNCSKKNKTGAFMIMHLCWFLTLLNDSVGSWQNTSSSFKYLQPPQNSSLHRTKRDPWWHPSAPVQPGCISCWVDYSFQKWTRWPPPILRGERWRLSGRSDSFITWRPDIQSWNRTRSIKRTSRWYTRLITMPCIILPENHRNNAALPKLNFKTSAWELKADTTSDIAA